MKENRKKNTIIVIVAVVMGVIYYKFPYAKERDKLNEVKIQHNVARARLNSYINGIDLLEKKESELKMLNSSIQDKTLRLYPYINEERLLLEIDKLIKESGLQGTLEFYHDNISEEKQQKYDSLLKLVNEYRTIENDDKSNKTSKDSMKISMEFKGTYENFESFIKAMDNHQRDVIIGEVKLQGMGDNVSGTLAMEFFAVPKIMDEDENYDDWPFENSYGKYNPFDMTSKDYQSESEAEEASDKNYDFVMSVKPLSSDLPTLTLGKSKDNSRSTYIYSDRNVEENVEISIEKKDGKYFYKYKTSEKSYPENYDSDGISFEPLERYISLKIFSTPKDGGTDSSGAKVTFINNTDKNVKIFVEGDDKDTPRVKVQAQGNGVDIIRK